MVSNFMEQFEKEQKEFDQNIKASRQIFRNTIHHLTLLSSAIVGFSVSIFSIPILQSSLDTSRLRWSWSFFLATIITGAAILFLSSRIRYAKTWKVRQPSKYLHKLSDYSSKEINLADLIVCITLIHPANLIFNKPCKDKEKEIFHQRVNGLVVHKLARMEHGLISGLENLFLIFFISGLVFLVISFKI